MTRITFFAILITCLSSAACGRRSLAPTFAKAYRGVMTAQAESRSRPTSPVRGDEAKRIIKVYYNTLGDAPPDATSAGSSGGMSGQTAPQPASGASANNPFAFKVR